MRMETFDWESPGAKPVSDSLFPIKFQASMAQVRTMADGSFRVVLDLGENDLPAAALLMATRGKVLEVEIRKAEG